METQSQYVIVYGRLDFTAIEKDDGDGLEVIQVASADEVRSLANQFINVIPDDLDWYQNYIKRWNEEDRLLITHQDDETFYFSATRATMNLGNFHRFIKNSTTETVKVCPVSW
jgi:oligoribonuclease NrnB/cAMP/cGMP phosphodiesterase (DHH superfamily)